MSLAPSGRFWKGDKHLELAAVVVVPAKNDFEVIHAPQPHVLPRPGISRPLYSSLLPILGNDVLRTWTDRVHKLGVQSFWLTHDPHDENKSYKALDDLAKQGVEQLLMIRLKSYAEMDLADLVRFHCQRRNSVTEVHDSRGQLGVCVLDHLALPAASKLELPYRSTGSECIPYSFRGYAKRILSATERQELVGDSLTGACAMRPFGNEIREQVWVGKNVSLASSAKVIGPTYIGDRTIIRPGAIIGPFASVECDCVVDYGTSVEQSTVLPHTYLAPGLLIRNALVDGRYLEDLSFGAVVDLHPAGLADRMQRRESDLQAASDVLAMTDSYALDLPPSSPEWRQVQL
jgi:carbonic anhydrase/acetyltransferase-like protein (isoleucine patch superfamily)